MTSPDPGTAVTLQARSGRLFRSAVAALLVAHGCIHALGMVEIWGWADVEELTGVPSIEVGSTAADVLAVAWPIALLLLVAAAGGLLLQRGWWRPVAIAGVVVSQFAIVIWWSDAFAGTIANALVVAAIVLDGRKAPRIGEARPA